LGDGSWRELGDGELDQLILLPQFNEAYIDAMDW